MRKLLGAVLVAGLLAGCGSIRPGGAGAPLGSAATPAGHASPSSTTGLSASAASRSANCRRPGTSTWPPPTGLTGLQFVSATQGWAVGGTVILHTSDGGQSWHVQDSGRLRLTAVDFIDAAHGWAAGAQTLLATSDGGQRWTSLPEPCPLIRSVHFVSPVTGFAVAGGTGLGEYSGVLAPQSGGTALRTTDGGRTWRSLATPPDAQSICFTSTSDGWLGAGGHLYRTTDGGRHWTMAARGPRPPSNQPPTMVVQCAGTASVWAIAIGPGAAMSQQPQVGYHAGSGGAIPIFAEQYFPHAAVTVTAAAPGAYSGPVSALSASAAVLIGWCPACGSGTAPWDLATADGSALSREGTIGGISQPTAASFISRQTGWVAGTMAAKHGRALIVGTTDGGRSWEPLYSTSG